MTYQHWLNSFAVELNLHRPDVSVTDIDPDFLESLYASGTLPADAVSVPFVFKDADAIAAGRSQGGASDDLKAARVTKFVVLLTLAVVSIGLFVAVIMRRAEPAPVQVHQDLPPDATSRSWSDGDTFGRPTPPTDTYVPPSYNDRLADEPPIPPSTESSSPSSEGTPVYRYTREPTQPKPDESTSMPPVPDQPSPYVPPRNEGPKVNRFNAVVTNRNAFGTDGKLEWSVSNAQSVEISKNGVPIPGYSAPDGSLNFTNAKDGDVFTITATKDGVTVGTSTSVSGGH